MDNTEFRSMFPEFADEQKYPDIMLDTWSAVAVTQLNENRWGDLYNQGIRLYTAHNIVLSRKNLVAAEKGKDPGGQSGILSSKSVGDVSGSYDTHAVTFENAGNFNLTTYGRDFWQLAQIVGMGGEQV